MTMITLTTGTAFIMWLGEQMTERGIGNGISMIIFAGIVAALAERGPPDPRVRPAARAVDLHGAVRGRRSRSPWWRAIIFMERGQRRIPVQYAKRVVGRRVYSGQSSHLPLKVNTAGVIPPIFASSVLLFPASIASMFGDNRVAQWVAGALDAGDAGSTAWSTSRSSSSSATSTRRSPSTRPTSPTT